MSVVVPSGPRRVPFRSPDARPATVVALMLALAVAAETHWGRQVDVVARGLEVPWALAFAADGRLFVTERPGRIRVVRSGRLDPVPVATLAVAALGEGGLMGLALDPGFLRNGRLYVCYTRWLGPPQPGTPLGNRVSRLVVRDDHAGDEQPLLDALPGATIHNGCRLRFGPDGMLYVSTGDAAQPPLAQRPDSLAGKILRIRADGSVPADNPAPGSYVYSRGHRNPQGLAWDGQGRLLAAEHGPTGHDEVNHIQPGRNYGWPDAVGTAKDPRFVDPVIESGDGTWAPSGIAWLGHHLYVASLRGRRLLRITLDTALAVQGVEPALTGYGRLRDVVVGPDGALYVATSNRDGRGAPASDDDRILRVQP